MLPSLARPSVPLQSLLSGHSDQVTSRWKMQLSCSAGQPLRIWLRPFDALLRVACGHQTHAGEGSMLLVARKHVS